jgi:uncharacterized protein
MSTASNSASKKANRLLQATSPYLLQHAYNPVDWFEWGAEALAKAVQEDKPILVSIGYSSCHWCHVMERESFEDTAIASLMNESFVCIKVDREERPDIDQIYMEAVQAMGIHGGWPLNVFLTPEQKPFYGGTYFQPQVWTTVLKNIHEAYNTKKNEIHESAEELTRILSGGDLERFRSNKNNRNLTDALDVIYNHLENKFDTTWGGLDKAPKFIMPSIWLWLLRYHYLTGNKAAVNHINLTLLKILDGGIYDQVGGGFARYSVDAEWFAPHFEKMLYDNAQLMSLYAEAFTLTHHPDYKRALHETFSWLKREMTHPEGGFYSALDADSEGVEGKYYCWTKQEIDSLLGNDAGLFCAYYGVTESGNWEHGQNILKRVMEEELFLSHHNLLPETWSSLLAQCNTILLTAREKRIKPGLDDKILSGWNAMMITGLVDAYHATGDEEFYQAAKKAMTFLEKNLLAGNTLYRSFKEKPMLTEAFLEDYAWLIKAYLKLYQADFNESWLTKASAQTSYVIRNFYDSEDGLFFFTSATAEKLIARKKEIFDNVIPSSNSIMAMNLHHLSIMLDKPEWKTLAEKMINGFSDLIQKEPNYMSNWGIAYLELHASLAEVAIVGNTGIETSAVLHKTYLPLSLIMGTTSSSELPLLKGKTMLNNKTTLYVCRDYRCRQPVHSVPEAIAMINQKP